MEAPFIEGCTASEVNENYDPKRVLAVIRFAPPRSKNERQFEVKLRQLRHRVLDKIDGPFHFDHVAEMDGEKDLVRRAFHFLEENAYDLVVTDDLARVCRQAAQVCTTQEFRRRCKKLGVPILIVPQCADRVRKVVNKPK